MAAAKPEAVDTQFDFEEMIETYQVERKENAAWRQAAEGRIRALQAAAVAPRKEASFIDKDDVVYVAGGAALGGGIAYVGAQNGMWEMNPTTIGIGVVGGAVAGYGVGRMLRKE